MFHNAIITPNQMFSISFLTHIQELHTAGALSEGEIRR